MASLAGCAGDSEPPAATPTTPTALSASPSASPSRSPSPSPSVSTSPTLNPGDVGGGGAPIDMFDCVVESTRTGVLQSYGEIPCAKAKEYDKAWKIVEMDQRDRVFKCPEDDEHEVFVLSAGLTTDTTKMRKVCAELL